MKVSVIGAAGYWSKNIIKTLKDFKGIERLILCDNSYTVLNGNDEFSDYKNAINHSDIVFVITPPKTHFEIAKFAIENKKHVFVEKPICLNFKDAREIVGLAKSNGVILHTDNTFIYTPEINTFKQIIDFDMIGKISYLQSTRANWGPFKKDIDVVWDLLCHDVSILNYIIPYKLEGVSATGTSQINKDIIEKANVTFFFRNDFKAFVDVSFLSHKKTRNIVLRGLNGFVCNDSSLTNQVMIESDREPEVEIIQPSLIKNPLYCEINHFFESIKQKKDTLSSGYEGEYVVKVLEKVSESIKRDGGYVAISN